MVDFGGKPEHGIESPPSPFFYSLGEKDQGTVLAQRGESILGPKWAVERRVRFVRLDVSLLHHEQTPFAGDAFEVVHAMIGKFNAGARDEILDGTRNHYFIRIRSRRYPRSNVHRD